MLEDKGGRQTVQQEQVGRWRLGPLRGIFSTHLRVQQDSHAHTITYELAKPSFMKAFAGSWQVQPFDQEVRRGGGAGGLARCCRRRCCYCRCCGAESAWLGLPS